MTVTETSSRSVPLHPGGLSTRDIQLLLDSSAETLDEGDREGAVRTLVKVPLDACTVGQLGKVARVSKRAGATELWTAASQLCIARFPRAPTGYQVLLADIDLLADPDLQQGALHAAMAGLELLASGELASAAVAFHVNRVIGRFSCDPALKVRSQRIATAVFAAADDGAVWHARDLMRLGELDKAAQVLDADAATLDGRPPEDARLVRARIALALGQWGRDWVHLKAVEALTSPAALKVRREVGDVRDLFAELGESFDAGPTTPRFRGISSPASAAEVICRGRTDLPPDRHEPPQGLLLAGGSLAAGGAERLMAICFREFRRRNVLGRVDLALRALRPREPHDDPLYFLPLTGAGVSELVRLDDASAIVRPFTYLRGGLARPTQSWYDLFSARRPKVVHAWLDYTMLSAGLAGVWAGVPKIILHSHNMRPESIFNLDDSADGQWRERGKGWRGIYAHLMSRPEVHFVNCSEVATADYLEWLEVDKSSINAHTIHNGLDFAPFDQDGRSVAAELRASLGIPNDAPVVGTALRFSPVKQPDHWVEAAIQIQRAIPDVHFVMFGDGEAREPLIRKIEAAGAAGYIHCPGRFADIHLRLQMLDVFMLSSRSEGLPNVLIESQACGVPVVAYDAGGVRETFVDGVTGRLVRDKNPASLAAAVVEVLRNRRWLLSASAEGRRFVRREFSINKMVTDLEALIGQ